MKTSSIRRGSPVKTRSVIAAVAATCVALVATLSGCGGDEDGSEASGGGGGGKAANCTNKIKNADAPVVTLWAWYPNTEKVVDNFNNAHDDVQVLIDPLAQELWRSSIPARLAYTGRDRAPRAILIALSDWPRCSLVRS